MVTAAFPGMVGEIFGTAGSPESPRCLVKFLRHVLRLKNLLGAVCSLYFSPYVHVSFVLNYDRLFFYRGLGKG